MRLYDLHADTPSRLFSESLPFNSHSLQLSVHDLPTWEHHVQVFACFTSPRHTNDEAFSAFFAMRRTLLSAIAPYRDRLSCILAVEDARLLGCSLDRLSLLAEAGVAVLTPLWRGETALGGAYDTKAGLSLFGKAAAKEALRLGMYLDASHASDASFFDLAAITAEAGVPLLATHSNARSICRHKRNLTDAQFSAVRESGGLVGLSLYPDHLTHNAYATVHDLVRHLEHWLSQSGEDTVALGTDFDGIDKTPIHMERNRDLLLLAEELLCLGYPEEIVRKLFYKNAERLFGKYEKK